MEIKTLLKKYHIYIYMFKDSLYYFLSNFFGAVGVPEKGISDKNHGVSQTNAHPTPHVVFSNLVDLPQSGRPCRKPVLDP